jgi:SecD/SecF fusion protein
MRTSRSHLLTVALIALALVGVVSLAIPSSPFHRDVKKGLDLQGGLEVVLEAQAPPGHKLTAADLDRSVQIMRNRIDKLGVSSPEIRKQGSNQIVIQLAGIHNPEQAAVIIGSTAQLELYDLEPALFPPSVSADGQPQAARNLYELLSRVQSAAKNSTPSGYVLFKPVNMKSTTAPGKKQPKMTIVWVKVAGPTTTLHRDKFTGNAGLLDATHGVPPKGDKVLPVPQNTVVITCSAKTTVVCPGDPLGLPPAGKTDYYLFKHGAYPGDRYGPYPNLSGNELKLSGTRQDFNPADGSPVVLMQFTGKGNKAFYAVSKNEAVRGSIKGAFQHFAIVLDNEIKSWPQIDYNLYPSGINPAGSGAQITGIGSLKEAQNLALVLQTGALPVKFVPLERTDVSATLGKDSLKQAWLAAIGGLVAVALFLLILYRFLGLVAVMGLAIYGAFMYAAILLFSVTLTLPGFAGLILTIGVAADANVVVFERIKEEVRAGKSMRTAIAAGYAKGFHTIIDANVVTAITALILFAVATAGVKGFALMLLIGTAVSLITAVAATRAMLGLLAGFRWFDNPRFMGASPAE